MRNRYYDTARLYAPSNSPTYQPKERADAISRNAKHSQDKQTAPGQSTKLNEKIDKFSSEAAMNEANQEQQVYIIDDSSNNANDDDDDSQIKYLYSLYRNRLSNNF